MKIIFAFLIFCLVLFIYLHIQFHLKTGDDLEIYEIDNPSKSKLEEICDLRQPLLFDFECGPIIETTNKRNILNNYNAFEVKVRNTMDYDDTEELYIPLSLDAAGKLFDADKKAMYFSENNRDFLEETALIKTFKYNDIFLRPHMVSNCNYDVMLGSNGSATPFRYEINYRNFFLLTQGSAQIKLAPPNCTKYLYPIYDYENFEFMSPINPWTPQPKYAASFDKMKCLEFTMNVGQTLFIPAYWWYSIKFNSNTSISCFRYRTYMNNIAISPYIAMYALQIQNIKRVVTKKTSILELNNVVNHSTNINSITSINSINSSNQGNSITNAIDIQGDGSGTDIHNLPGPIVVEDNINNVSSFDNGNNMNSGNVDNAIGFDNVTNFGSELQ